MFEWLNERRKFLIGLVGSLTTVAVALLGEDHPWVAVLVALATALGIERVPNARSVTWRRGDAGQTSIGVVILLVVVTVLAVFGFLALFDLAPFDDASVTWR